MLKQKKIMGSLPPGAWVFSLYFIEGLPFSLVNTVSVALFKTLEISNSQIGLFTSLFYTPWALKFFWAPLVDYFASRRKWLITMQWILSALILGLALLLYLCPSFFALCCLFAAIAIASATYDIACDGFYLDSLNKSEQSLYIGWRNTAYKIAWLFASGFLVYTAGIIAGLNPGLGRANSFGWSISFLIAAFIFAIGAIFHSFILPRSTAEVHREQTPTSNVKETLLQTFNQSFNSFFRQKNILLILFWILTFRAGDAMLLKMAQPFLMEIKEKGGLALSLQSVGFLYGTVGVICLLFGGLLGGWLIFKLGLKKCILPGALLQSLTLPLYLLLAIFKPALIWVALANGFEQFVYGLATAMYTNYLFTIAKDKFVASHYAIATGFMAIGMIFPGAISGYLVDKLGYPQFFLCSFFVSIPGLVFTYLLPFHSSNTENIQV